MELIQKTIRYNQEGKKTFDQFYLDEDYNVPDAKQDVRRIIKGQGTVKIEDVKLVENYVRISGKLYFQILYVTDQGEPMPAVLDGKIPFEEMVYTEGEERTQYFVRNIRVEFGTTLVHSRKISIRAMIEMEVGCENLIEEETAVETGESLKAAYCEKGYIPHQRRNYDPRNKREHRSGASDGYYRAQAGSAGSTG